MDISNLMDLISKIYSRLKILSFTTQSKDIAYLNAKRWEQLISKYLPHLKKFYLNYYECFDYTNKYSIYPGESDQFNSLFWIE